MTEADLRDEGYDPVYTWNAEPGEEDPEHDHAFDTKLVVLKGEINITQDGKTKTLKVGDTIEIPREKAHAGLAGPEGCTYLMGERH